MNTQRSVEGYPAELRIRATNVIDDYTGPVYTTTGSGYDKVSYVRKDLVPLDGPIDLETAVEAVEEALPLVAKILQLRADLYEGRAANIDVEDIELRDGTFYYSEWGTRCGEYEELFRVSVEPSIVSEGYLEELKERLSEKYQEIRRKKEAEERAAAAKAEENEYLHFQRVEAEYFRLKERLAKS